MPSALYKSIRLTLAGLLIAAWWGSICALDVRAADPARGVEVFEKQIRPLLARRCYACHSQKAGKREGGLWLDRRAGWTAGGDRGPAVVPGKVAASLLIRAVQYGDPDLQMPPDKKLTAKEIARLVRWVQQGAPAPKQSDSAIAGYASPADPIAGRSHWAFRPLLVTPPPRIAEARQPIDAFVLSRLRSLRLKPAPPAGQRTLLRRATFVLTGLPPTVDATRGFLGDSRPDAYARRIDRLLTSPRFGERWGRHWLDLARYADSNGLDENFLFREAWRYRNWVLDAVDSDMPYDRFLLAQIAGDLLPYRSIAQRDRQRIAAGFLVVGPKVLLGNDPRERRMDVADEQLDTLGRAVLGLTLGCARCHDHKFDPIPTADYYKLAGILTSTEVMEKRYMLGSQRLMERLVGLGPKGDQADGAYETYWRERSTRQQRVKQAQQALKLLKSGDEKALAALAKKHPAAVAPEAGDSKQTRAARKKSQQALLEKLVAAAKPPPIPPRAMIPCDRKKPADEAIRLAGRFDRLGKRVPRGFLQVVSDRPANIPSQASGRRQLALWLTDSRHGAGQLAARVLANRIWRHMIGRGLVRTVDNFGRAGEKPTHPELLDYLARRLIEQGWSVKALVREIALSDTFRRSTQGETKRDPDNRWLARAHRRRLEPEALRDAMLYAAGQLDLKRMDSTVWYLGDQATAVGANKNRRRTDFPVRSVYLPVIRNDLPELFAAFDFADPHATTGQRPQTLVAMQSLFLLNDPSVMKAAEALAKRVLSAPGAAKNPERIAERLYEVLLNQQPTAAEKTALLTFVRTAGQRLKSANPVDAPLPAWTLACHALLASSRFQILE